MIKKSRFRRLDRARGCRRASGAIALADGAGTNEAFVDGSIKPGEARQEEVQAGCRSRCSYRGSGRRQRPAVESAGRVHLVPKNIKFDFNAGDVCSTLPPSGSTPDQAKDACPPARIGVRRGRGPGPGLPGPIDDIVVSVFRGPDKKGIQLHTYSPTLRPGVADGRRLDREVERRQQVRLRAEGARTLRRPAR